MANVIIKTSEGDITVRLYDETPRHRDNFLKLAKEDYYEGTLFHRVIKNFMIQGGDPNSKDAPAGMMLGTGGPGYTIPAEILPQFIHKRGALAAARQGDEVNPERASSGSQFYIVWGQVYNEGQMGQLAKQMQMQAEQAVFNRLAFGLESYLFAENVFNLLVVNENILAVELDVVEHLFYGCFVSA